MNPSDLAKKRLFGRRATNADMARYVANRILGSTGQPPMTISEICRQLQYKDPKSIRAFRALALELGYLQAGENGRIQRPQRSTEFQAFLDNDQFAQHELIKPWIEDMANRKGGKPIKTMRHRIRTFKKLCNILRVDPGYWTAPGNTQEVLTHVAKTMQGFNTDLQSGKIRAGKGDPADVLYGYVGPLRDFLAFYGYSFARGASGVMSQKASRHIGKYPDVKLSDEQIDKVLEMIKDKYGIDSDMYRIFAFGVQTCARHGAIFTTKLDSMDWQKSPKGAPLLIVKVFESKTEEIRGGIWEKAITWPELQNAIVEHAKKHTHLVIERGRKPERLICDQLRDIYRQINPNNISYFLDKPIHVLRHVGAHYWLSRCEYNHSIVADIGGWNTVDELKRSYGAIPKSEAFRVLGL